MKRGKEQNQVPYTVCRCLARWSSDGGPGHRSPAAFFFSISSMEDCKSSIRCFACRIIASQPSESGKNLFCLFFRPLFAFRLMPSSLMDTQTPSGRPAIARKLLKGAEQKMPSTAPMDVFQLRAMLDRLPTLVFHRIELLSAD